jgi:prepilin-type processing-associated H-X9-DG protein
MLLPAISRAQVRARTANCMNNLRQWGMALQGSAADGQNQIPRDGTIDTGQYAPDITPTSPTTGPATPDDPFAWFNVLPPLVGERSLSNYYNLGPAQTTMPFPGNSVGSKIWHCPSARGAGETFYKNGRYGFFSYAMNLDLKLKSSIRNGVAYNPATGTGNSYPYPFMPSLGAVAHSSAVVFMTEATFSPSQESFVPGVADRNGLLPSVRWNRFVKRHNNGGNIVFLDGHAQTYSYDYVFNPKPTDSNGREEKWGPDPDNPNILNRNPDIWWNPNRDKP